MSIINLKVQNRHHLLLREALMGIVGKMSESLVVGRRWTDKEQVEYQSWQHRQEFGGIRAYIFICVYVYVYIHMYFSTF